MRPQEATLSVKTRKHVWLIAAALLSSYAVAQEPADQPPEGWHELPRNTTIYVPAPRPAMPVDAYRSCSNRYEGDYCDFSSPGIGFVEGICEAPVRMQPQGYEQRQYPNKIRTALVCMPSSANVAPQVGDGNDPADNPTGTSTEEPTEPRQ